MTNHFSDLKNSNVIVACGGNNAENHPASMRWINRARVETGAKYLVVDPRFNRSAAVADVYVPIRSGTDIVFFGGLINYCLSNGKYNKEYVANYTNAPFLINDRYSFEDGMFAGWDEAKQSYDKSAWSYQIEGYEEWDTSEGGKFAWAKAEGVPEFDTPKVPIIAKDMELENPRCVFQLMKDHYSRYTPEKVSAICGMSEEQFNILAEIISETAAPEKVATFLYAMGLTQHTKGSQNIRALAILQLILGNMGRPGGGVNALRGESNVQGSTDWGLLYDNLPGYTTIPKANEHQTLKDYLNKTTAWGGYYVNRPKFFISLLKEWWGDNAQKENDFCYDYLPKIDAGQNLSFLNLTDRLDKQQMKVLFCMGTNPASGGANATVIRNGLANLDMLVCTDLWETETSIFWKAPGVDPAQIQTEVYFFPMAGHYEKEGTVANSGRWLQWRYQAVKPRGEVLDDGEFYNRLYKGIKQAMLDKPGVFDDPILDLYWDYETDGHFDPRKSALGANGYVWKKNGEHGKMLSTFGDLKADGSTACSMWIYTGYYCNEDALDDPSQQACGSRVNEDVTVDGLQGGLGQYPKWAYAWPLNRRVIYNRCSVDMNGQPWDPEKPLLWFKDGKWLRNDTPDFGFKSAGKDLPPEKCPSFMMNTESVARLFAAQMNEGPFPEHYEPIESPVKNLMSSVQNNPKALIIEDLNKTGNAEEYPIICTNYRLSEHWQTGGMTRNVPWLAEAQPKMFVEISEELAAEKGIQNGDMVDVFNNRGRIKVNAMVTKRFKPFTIDGKTVHQVGMPWHWGYATKRAHGAIANDITPSCGDANSSIPEYKAFLVQIEKAVK